MNGKDTIKTLKRLILNLNDVLGAKAKVSLTKGKDLYSSRIIIEAKEAPILTDYLNTDNYDNKYVG